MAINTGWPTRRIKPGAQISTTLFRAKHNFLLIVFCFSYYRCSRYKTFCPGRCVVDDTKIRLCTEHNHPPEPDRVLVDKFRKVLTSRAASETKDLYTIYWEEASQRHSDAALLYTFNAAESAMRKARRYKQLPLAAPNNVQDFDNILNNTNMFRIHSGSRRDPFYQTTLTLNDDSVCVIFMHMKTIETIGHIDEIHINDGINGAPDIQLTHHLMIVHAVKNYYVGCRVVFNPLWFFQLNFNKIPFFLCSMCQFCMQYQQ